MATFYSDHFSATVSSTSADDPRPKIASGVNHGAIRYKRGTVTTTAATSATDVLAFFPIKSGDRILDLLLTTPGDAGTAVTLDLGVHDFELSAVDADLFASAVDVKVAVARVDQFVEAGTLEQEDRGKKLYELVDEALGTTEYDEDPLENWILTGTVAAETLIAGAEIVLEVYYTADGN